MKATTKETLREAAIAVVLLVAAGAILVAAGGCRSRKTIVDSAEREVYVQQTQVSEKSISLDSIASHLNFEFDTLEVTLPEVTLPDGNSQRAILVKAVNGRIFRGDIAITQRLTEVERVDSIHNDYQGATSVADVVNEGSTSCGLKIFILMCVLVCLILVFRK